jgi:hypothetical protein
MKANHENAKKGLRDQFNKQIDEILLSNQKTEKYWILGKVRFPPEFGGKVGRVFMQACLEKPPLIRGSFLYEVDNTRGVKTLLWVMNSDNTIRLPTLNKTVKLHT